MFDGTNEINLAEEFEEVVSFYTTEGVNNSLS
jgi:hypothetical protein